MNGSEYEDLRAASLQRSLSPEEASRLQQHLSQHPRELAEWEEDQGLNRLLSTLPAIRPASNFTSQVLQRVALEERQQERATARPRPGIMPSWLRRLAFAAVALGVGTLSYEQYQASVRQERARSLATISGMASLPGPELLRDFDAIQSLNLWPQDVDLDLLAALQ
jgi:anti-sigma factor RsiW